MTLLRSALTAAVLCVGAALASGQTGQTAQTGLTIDTSFSLGGLASRTPIAANPSPGGGLFTGFSVAMFSHSGLGVGIDSYWRDGRFNFSSLPTRPYLNTLNGYYAPSVRGRFKPEVWAGIGLEDFEVYPGSFLCGTPAGCTVPTTADHFLVDGGAGMKIYLNRHWFVRPEVALYNVFRNSAYQVPNLYRAGFSIGYTFGNLNIQ